LCSRGFCLILWLVALVGADLDCTLQSVYALVSCLIEYNVATKIDTFVALLMHVCALLISKDGFLPLN
jgi:hypothetical protein